MIDLTVACLCNFDLLFVFCQTHLFINKKARRSFFMKRNPREISWTVLYRLVHHVLYILFSVSWSIPYLHFPPDSIVCWLTRCCCVDADENTRKARMRRAWRNEIGARRSFSVLSSAPRWPTSWPRRTWSRKCVRRSENRPSSKYFSLLYSHPHFCLLLLFITILSIVGSHRCNSCFSSLICLLFLSLCLSFFSFLLVALFSIDVYCFSELLRRRTALRRQPNRRLLLSPR